MSTSRGWRKTRGSLPGKCRPALTSPLAISRQAASSEARGLVCAMPSFPPGLSCQLSQGHLQLMGIILPCCQGVFRLSSRQSPCAERGMLNVASYDSESCSARQSRAVLLLKPFRFPRRHQWACEHRQGDITVDVPGALSCTLQGLAVMRRPCCFCSDQQA